MPTPVATPVVFPFEPDGIESVHETWEYVTDVLTSHNDKEQRFALRRRPTIRLQYRVTTMNVGESSRLTAALWKTIGNRWYVPIWPHARIVTNVAGGVYSIDTTDTRFDAGGKVLVWRDSVTWDLMTFSSSAGGSVTLTGATTFVHGAGVFVIPVMIGALSQSYDIDRSNIISSGLVEFELDTTNTTLYAPAAALQIFRGIEVLNLHVDTVDGTEREHWTLSSERSGGALGPFLMRPYAASPVVLRKSYWVLSSRAERAAFRAWLAARRGRKNPLWVPTYQDDVTLSLAAAFNAGSLDVYAANFAGYLGANPRLHLAALMPDRTVMPLTVTNVSVPSAGVERLFLEAPLTAAIPLNTRISFLTYARLSEDAVTMEHINADASLVSASFTELPRETPA
jgi:hypothetical protein